MKRQHKWMWQIKNSSNNTKKTKSINDILDWFRIVL